jgi:hypothetical protein
VREYVPERDIRLKVQRGEQFQLVGHEALVQERGGLLILMMVVVLVVMVLLAEEGAEVLFQFQEAVFYEVEASVGFRAFEGYKEAEGCEEFPVVLLYNRLVDKLFEEDPGVGNGIDVDIGVVTLEEDIDKFHLQGTYLTESDVFA